MDLEFTDDQLDLRDNVRAVLAGASPPSLVRGVFEGTDTARELWAQQVELHWPGLAIPESLGGVGLGPIEVAIVCEEIGRSAAPGPLLATLTQFVPAVLEARSADQQQRFCTNVIEGHAGSLAVAENHRWDASQIVASASPLSDGGWVIDGTKTGVVGAADAAALAVVARGPGGLGLFVVPTAEVHVRARDVLDRAVPLADVIFNRVEVPSDRVILRPGDEGADSAIARILEHATLGVALGMVGACRRIFDETLAYSKVRVQYDRPIGSFQALKHRMADMYLAVERAAALCYFAAATVAEHDVRRAEAVAVAKAAAGDCQRLVAQEGLQLHGGIGMTWEHDLHFLLKRAKSGEVLFGTSVFHRTRIARMLGLLTPEPAGAGV